MAIPALAAIAGGAVLSGIGSAVGASQAKGAQQRSLEARQQALEGLSDSERTAIFGSVPELPDYVPVDLTQSQRDTVSGNLSVFPKADRLARRVGEANLNIDLNRARGILPDYDEIVESQSANIAALSRGELPIDDVLDIVSERSQLSNRLGLAGSGIGTNATLRDLGLSRLQAQQQGQNMFQSFMATAAQAISPLSRQGDVRESMLTPAQRAQIDVQQRTMEFQAQTAQAHAAAMPDPAASQIFMAQLGNESQLAGLQGFNPWISSIAQTAGSAIGNFGARQQETNRQNALMDRQTAALEALAARNPY